MSIDSDPMPNRAPMDFEGPRIPLYSEEFAADPGRVYRELRRRYGSLAPVDLAPGISATLVIGYHTALRILHDPEHFPADPRIWEKGIAADCPIRPMMEWRPNSIRSAGSEHIRFRSATVSALDQVDLHHLHATVERIAIPLINSFCEEGACDVVGQYAYPLILSTLNAMFGCSPGISQRAAAGMAAVFDTVGAAEGSLMLTEALLELSRTKRTEPGADVTSRLIEHPVNLDDVGVVHQLVTLYAAGIEPQQNLIINTLQLMLTDARFAGDMLGGSLSTRDALNEVLFNDPPLANYCISYPRQPILIEGVWLPAHQPVLISMAACNNDPAIRIGEFTDNRSHLAFSAGPHRCPARPIAELIVQDAIDQLLDALPEIQLAVPAAELEWRPGPFHRALVSLPVTFPKSPPLSIR